MRSAPGGRSTQKPPAAAPALALLPVARRNERNALTRPPRPRLPCTTTAPQSPLLRLGPQASCATCRQAPASTAAAATHRRRRRRRRPRAPLDTPPQRRSATPSPTEPANAAIGCVQGRSASAEMREGARGRNECGGGRSNDGGSGGDSYRCGRRRSGVPQLASCPRQSGQLRRCRPEECRTRRAPLLALRGGPAQQARRARAARMLCRRWAAAIRRQRRGAA